MSREDEKIAVLKEFYLIPLKEVKGIVEADPAISVVPDYIVPKHPSLDTDDELLQVAYSALAMRIYGYGLIKAPAGHENIVTFYDMFNEIANSLESEIGQEIVVRPDLSDPEGFRRLKLLV